VSHKKFQVIEIKRVIGIAMQVGSKKCGSKMHERSREVIENKRRKNCRLLAWNDVDENKRVI